MKAKALLLIASFAGASLAHGQSQNPCTPSSKLVYQFPVSACVLLENTVGLNTVQTGQTLLQSDLTAVQTALNPINASFATQLSQLPVPSAAIGTVPLRKDASDPGSPFANLGPILTDRPDTVRRGQVFIGFAYQHFNFNQIDGVHFSSLPIGFSSQFVAPSGQVLTFYAAEMNAISFHLDQYIALASLGLSKSTDVTVIVPVNKIALQVVTTQFQGYLYNPASSSYTVLTPAANAQTPLFSHGSASGLGDISVVIKQMLIGQRFGKPAASVSAQFRFPSGDSQNYLGSGTLGGSLNGLFEYRARVAPHLKLAYQWNDTSSLMNIYGPRTQRLPGGLQYAAGADMSVNRKLSLAFDLLGSQFDNAPTFALGATGLAAPATGSAPVASIPSISHSANTYTTRDFSAGVKCLLEKHILVYGNVLIQMNNAGLRADPVPLIGIAYKSSRKTE